MNPERFLSPEDVQRINSTIAEVERTNSGEIVPMVVGASDDYPHLPYIGGVHGLLLAAAVTLIATGDPHPHTWVPALVGGFLGGYILLLLSPALRRLILARGKAADEVMERALRAFRAHRLSRTRDRTGILILISLLERRVQVLADEGINARVAQGTWDEVVEIILDGIASGTAGEAICRAIRRCGDLLAEQFPISPGDKDELPNRLIIES
jgi:putative membrane protein